MEQSPFSRGRDVAARGAGLASLLLLGGCDLLRSDQFLPLWAAVPLLIFGGAGSLFVFTRRKQQLDGWDLRESTADPGVSGVAGRVIGAAFAVFVAFATYDGLLEGADRSLRVWNAVLWLAGSALGVALALLLGLRGAERALRAGRLSSRRP